MRYDTVIVGTEPDGRRAAVSAALDGEHVCVIERPDDCHGGLIFHGSLIQSRGRQLFRLLQDAVRATLPAAWSYADGPPARVGCELAPLGRCVEQAEQQLDADFDQDCRVLGVERIRADAWFCGRRQLLLNRDGAIESVTADRIIIATGTLPRRPLTVPFDTQRVIDTDSLLKLERIPESMIVVNEGPLGAAYARLLATAGLSVTLINSRAGAEANGAGLHEAALPTSLQVFNDDVVSLDPLGTGDVHVQLLSGRHLTGGTVMFDAGRIGNTARLDLESAGIMPDEHGRLWCNDDLQTWSPCVYGSGDVVGFPTRDWVPPLAVVG